MQRGGRAVAHVGRMVEDSRPCRPARSRRRQPRRTGWNRDEWDVALSDGGLYRIFEDRETGRWFVGAVVD